MSADPAAWMPIYIGDYLGDTTRFTTEQHGAYLLLIFDYWRNGPAPDDDAILAQITRMDKAGWKRSRAAIIAKFQIDGGMLRHRRIDAELEAARTNQGRRSSKAQTAANARWGNAPGNAPSIPPGNAPRHAPRCPPPSPSPSPSEKKNDDGSRYAFAGSTIRVDQEQFAAWAKAFHAIPDLNAQLTALDGWFGSKDEECRAKWFHSTPSMLNKSHKEALAANKPPDKKRERRVREAWETSPSL